MIRSRKDAIAAKEKTYFTGKPCNHGHMAPRYVGNRGCSDCLGSSAKQWKAENPDKRRLSAMRRRHANPVPNRENVKAWQLANPEKHRASSAQRCAKRRTRTPRWADTSAMRAFYAIAGRVSQCTGITFEVDHIEPLCGENFSGLHVPWNLRVIPAHANRRKSNRRDDRVLSDWARGK